MLKLIVASPNYSSWSLRAWLALHALQIPFTTEIVSLCDFAKFKKKIQKYSPAGKVPVLVHPQFKVYDTLAILETVHELYPQAGIWHEDFAKRARARAMCAEMHSGFLALRQACPMNIRARFHKVLLPKTVLADSARLVQMWSECLASDATQTQPFLLGKFSAVDAYFAPVVFRFQTYAINVPAPIRQYMNAVLNHPSTRAWIKLAAQNDEWLEEDEPYQNRPTQQSPKK